MVRLFALELTNVNAPQHDNGLSEFDVMTMAGHASFETTRRFYLAVRSDLLDRARKASSAALKFISDAKLLQVPTEAQNRKACDL